MTALASVRLGGTRLFLSGGEETLIRVHQVQILLCRYLFGGYIFSLQCPKAICLSKYLKHNENFSSPDDKQEQFERGGSSARSPLKYPLSDRLTSLCWLSQEKNLNAKRSDKEQ